MLSFSNCCHTKTTKTKQTLSLSFSLISLRQGKTQGSTRHNTIQDTIRQDKTRQDKTRCVFCLKAYEKQTLEDKALRVKCILSHTTQMSEGPSLLGTVATAAYLPFSPSPLTGPFTALTPPDFFSCFYLGPGPSPAESGWARSNRQPQADGILRQERAHVGAAPYQARGEVGDAAKARAHEVRTVRQGGGEHRLRSEVAKVR